MVVGLTEHIWKKSWVIPSPANAEFVACMEDVLDVYKQPYDPLYPQVCFDECSKQPKLRSSEHQFI